jgi:recombination protein RecA
VPPCRAAEFNILFDKGIDSQGSLLETAESLGVVTRRGAYYYLGEQKLGQGKDKAAAALAEDSKLTEEVEAKIQEALAGSGGLLQLPSYEEGAAGDEVEEEVAGEQQLA